MTNVILKINIHLDIRNGTYGPLAFISAIEIENPSRGCWEIVISKYVFFITENAFYDIVLFFFKSLFDCVFLPSNIWDTCGLWMDIKPIPLNGIWCSTPENEATVLYSSFPGSKPISYPINFEISCHKWRSFVFFSENQFENENAVFLYFRRGSQGKISHKNQFSEKKTKNVTL